MTFPDSVGVGTLDLNLDNAWWNETLTMYLNSNIFETWFISTLEDDIVSFRSSYAETKVPKKTSEIVIDLHEDEPLATEELRT